MLPLHLIHKISKGKQDLIYLLKQLPPKPGLEFKNFEPILLSNPMALETSLYQHLSIHIMQL